MTWSVMNHLWQPAWVYSMYAKKVFKARLLWESLSYFDSGQNNNISTYFKGLLCLWFIFKTLKISSDLQLANTIYQLKI